MGSSGEQNTVSKFEPPEHTQQGWEQYVQRATSLADKPTPRYEGQTVAGPTQQHMLGQGMLMNTALNGTAAGNAANSQLFNTLQGGFDNPYATTLNPYGTESAYLDQVIGRANQKTLADYEGNLTANDRSHAGSRTMGSAKQMLQQQKMAESLGEGMQGNAINALNQNYYGNQGIAENQLNRATGAVDNERNRQMQAAGMAPQQQQMDFEAVRNLMAGGDMQRSYNQELLDQQGQDFWRFVQDPSVRLDLMGSALSRASGGAGTTSSQIMGGMNPFQMAGGLGLLGAGMYNGFNA